jgi:hypothetical protein
MVAAGTNGGWLPAAGLPDAKAAAGCALRAVQGLENRVCGGEEWGTLEGSRGRGKSGVGVCHLFWIVMRNRQSSRRVIMMRLRCA